jgi:hypothetical protein
MKIIPLKFSILFFLLHLSTSLFAQEYIQEEKKQIIGTWISEGGSIKLVFTPITCKEFFSGKYYTTYKYRISNDSIQCGEEVYINKDEQTSYLEMINYKTNDTTCYEIVGLESEILSIRYLGTAIPAVYNRMNNEEKKEQASHDFSGTWTYSTSNSEFILELLQNSTDITGTHCSVMQGGNRIDCSDDEVLSIKGFLKNQKNIVVDFKSFYSGTNGKATIRKINNSTIEWKIIEKPAGEFHIPESVILKKQ